MKILVGCEESQAVTLELRNLGHEAYSCDIEPCSGGHPEWHIQADVLPLLNGFCAFATMDDYVHEVNQKWDMLIAFPPCTYLTSAGTRHYSLRMNSVEKVEARISKRNEAVGFFMSFANADCEKIVIENPVGYMNTHWRKPNQIIHPYYFSKYTGDENHELKRTCLWIKGLKPLKYILTVDKPTHDGVSPSGKKYYFSEMHGRTKSGGDIGAAKARSKTFPGIAKAMANQWGGQA